MDTENIEYKTFSFYARQHVVLSAY